MPSGGASLSICDTVSWNGGRAVVAHPERLAVEHRLRDRQARATASTMPGQRRR